MSRSPQAAWRKSSRSHGDSGDCVEVAAVSGMVGIRDTKNRAAGRLHIGRREFAALLNEVKAGRYDL